MTSRGVGMVGREGRSPGPAARVPQRLVTGAAEQGVLQLQRMAGNAAVVQIMRTPKARGTPKPMRIVYIDADVLGQINRGNKEAAKKLRELTRTGGVRMSAWNYAEATARGKDLMHRKANAMLVEDLDIAVDEPLTQAERVERSTGAFHDKPKRGGETLVQMKDIPTASNVPPGGELWSFDRTFRKDPKRIEKAFDIKVAPESRTIALVKGDTDYAVARELLGLEPVVIDEDGKLVRRGRQGLVVKGKVKTQVPSGEIVSGEIGGGPKRTGGGGGGGGSTATKVGSKAEEALVKTEGTLIKAEGKFVRGAAKVGQLADMLLPGPLDAIMLMADYAGAYEEARDAIRRRNFRGAFKLGLATALVGLERPWMRENFARKFVNKDVITQVLGAVGIAEKEFNKGLEAGLSIGETFPQAQKDVLVQAGFDALVAEGHRIASEAEIFTLETVARLARVLKRDVEAVLDELERYVYPIGTRAHRAQTAVVQDVPVVQTTTEKVRAVWMNMEPGRRKLALITDTSSSIPGTALGESRRLDWVPERIVPLALERTKRKFGKVESLDSPHMERLRAGQGKR